MRASLRGNIRPKSYKYHSLQNSEFAKVQVCISSDKHFSEDINKKITQKRYKYMQLLKNVANVLNSLLTMYTICNIK